MPVEPPVDPRIRRTRQMLFQALRELLAERGFEKITMQDIADRSTVNRGTIYAHFKDKAALLAALIEEQFRAMFDARMAGASATCQEGVRQLILTVCDFVGSLNPGEQRPCEPIVEAAVRTIVRNFLLEGLRHSKNVTSCADAELRATAGTWAICGTVLEWNRTRSTTAKELAAAVLPLVSAGLLVSGVRRA